MTVYGASVSPSTSQSIKVSNDSSVGIVSSSTYNQEYKDFTATITVTIGLANVTFKDVSISSTGGIGSGTVFDPYVSGQRCTLQFSYLPTESQFTVNFLDSYGNTESTTFDIPYFGI